MLKAIKLTFRALTLSRRKKPFTVATSSFQPSWSNQITLLYPLTDAAPQFTLIIHRGTNTVTHSRRHQSEAYLLYKTMSGTQSISGGMFITLFPP